MLAWGEGNVIPELLRALQADPLDQDVPHVKVLAVDQHPIQRLTLGASSRAAGNNVRPVRAQPRVRQGG